MKVTSSLAELKSRVLYDDLGKWDEEVKVSDLRVDEDGMLINGFRRMPLYDHAQSQLYTKLGIPAHYARRCPPELITPHINHWLESKGEKETWLLRGKSEGVRAILSADYAIFDNRNIIKIIEDNIADQNLQVVMSSVGDGVGFHARLVIPDVKLDTGALRTGERDVIFGGIHISNSEIGTGSASVELMLWRLVCTNGMVGLVRDSGARQVHRGKNVFDNFEKRMGDVFKNITSDARFNIAAYGETMMETTEIGGLIVQHYAEKNNLNKSTQDELQNQLRVQSRSKTINVFSKYDIVNAYTAAARIHQGDDRYNIEAIAGRLLNTDLETMERRALSGEN